jgi:hypothetical protein
VSRTNAIGVVVPSMSVITAAGGSCGGTPSAPQPGPALKAAPIRLTAAATPSHLALLACELKPWRTPGPNSGAV